MRVFFLLLAAALLQAVPAAAGSAGRCGGTGGSHTKTLTCPSGQYIAGLAARGGLFVDEYSIACRKIPVSGPAGSLGEFMSAGPGGGTSTSSRNCDKGHAVYDIWFKSGIYIDQADQGFCTKRSGDGWSRDRSSEAGISAGGSGGGTCTITCPDGEAMYKLTIKYGGWIDSIRGECRK